MVKCLNCSKEVNDYSQTTKFILTGNGSQRAGDSIELSCGCVVDFPEYDLDLNNGLCVIRDFTGQAFLEFYDEELIMEEDEE